MIRTLQQQPKDRQKPVARFHQQTWGKFLFQQKQNRHFKKTHNQLEDFLSGVSLSADVTPPVPLNWVLSLPESNLSDLLMTSEIKDTRHGPSTLHCIERALK